MRIAKLWFVEIDSPRDFAGLSKVARKHNGRYHPRIGQLLLASFVFGKEDDAKAFFEEAKDWPQMEASK